MYRSAFSRLFLVSIILLTGSNLYSQISGFNKIKWDRERIAPGLIWKSTHSVLNDSLMQNINILIVNTRRRAVSLVYDPGRNVIVRTQAEKAGALSAVNAGFFNIKDGGSVTYIRSGGLVADVDTAKKWKRNSNMTGVLMADKKGHICIDHSRTNSWFDSHQEFPEVLVTGPLLVAGKSKIILPSTSLVTVRHPRTVIGTRSKHRIVLVTLDGRTDQAKGMTLKEVSDLMLLLHCRDAVNLDGGGSTTMWISGKPFNGVVNMPCDNKKFDHEGERAVSDILIIR